MSGLTFEVDNVLHLTQKYVKYIKCNPKIVTNDNFFVRDAAISSLHKLCVCVLFLDVIPNVEFSEI